MEAVRRFFGGEISLDPCSNAHSTVGAETEWTLPEVDGLREKWNHRSVFVNPPYGRDRERGTSIYNWLSKCAEARDRYGTEVLALVPVATNTRHWKDFVFGAATAVAFLYDTRLRFHIEGRPSSKGSPRPCAMVYWGERSERFGAVFGRFGAVVLVEGSAPPAQKRRLLPTP